MRVLFDFFINIARWAWPGAGLVLARGLGFTFGVLHHVAVLGSIFANLAFVKSMRALISSW